MQPVFTDRRFGDGARPRPFDYVLYLSRYYYIEVPTANSANKDTNAFSGFYAEPNSPTSTDNCDYAALYKAAVGTPVGKGRVPPPFQSLRLADAHVLDMKRMADQLVVEVGPAPGSWEDVVFPYPPASGFFDAPIGVSAIDIVSSAGSLLYRWRREAYVDWYEDCQYEDDGRLRYLELAGAPPLISTAIEIPEAISVTLLPGSIGQGPTFPTGTVRILDSQGKEIFRQSWEEHAGEWQPLARISLAAGTYTMSIEVPSDSPVGSTGLPFRHFVLIRDDLPLP
jgi:hypothetical protein